MYGYGWGGHDTWAYLTNYNEDAPIDDGVDIVTAEQKQAATWQDSLEYPSAYQVGYMRDFLGGTGKTQNKVMILTAVILCPEKFF